ncbi:MAG: DUF4202 domain-containing protein [Gammaproteobacteria bacterium]
MDAFARARELIDAAHAADPTRAPDGTPAELAYANRMESWIARLVPACNPVQRLAARCQHLERWRVPRSAYPQGKPGYFAWRRGLYVKQAERTRQILREAGVPDRETETIAAWVAKKDLQTDPGAQALEDAACLVFLETELARFAAQHADYPREKFVDILRKTWRKMSPRGRDLALGLAFPKAIESLVREALAEP